MVDTIKKVIITTQKPADKAYDFPEEMPLLPLRDVVLFPNMIIPILVAREASVEALQSALMQDKYLFLVLQKNPEIEVPEGDDIYNIGVIGRALQVLKLPNGTAKVLIEGLSRARLKAMEKIDKHFCPEMFYLFREVL